MAAPDQSEFERLLEQLENLLQRRHDVSLPRELARRDMAERATLEHKLSKLLRPTGQQGQERRLSVRVPCQLPGWVSVAGGPRANAQVLDVSGGGVRARCDAKAPVGTAVEVGLLPHEDLLGDELALAGRIAWAQDGAFGVAFSSVNAATQRTLLRLVLRLIRSRARG